MDKKEAKERMKCCVWRYVSEKEALEALIRGDDEKLAKIQSLCGRLDIVNANMCKQVDEDTPEQLEKQIDEFTYPKEHL